MAKTIKMCDMSIQVATTVFYPEGWYYAKGKLRNKHTSTTGMYSEARMVKSNRQSWADFAKYSTR